MNMNFNRTPQRTYNLYIGRNEHPIDFGTLNNFAKSEFEESQTGEKMFDILDEIDKNIKEAEKNIYETNKIQNMYNQKNIENLKRLRQNRFNSNKIRNNFNNFQEGIYQNDKNFNFEDKNPQYETPVKIINSNFNDQKNIKKNNIISNNPKIIMKNNKFKYNKFNTPNNSRYEENNKTQDYLNYQNIKNIPKGYIRRAKSATHNNFNKSKNNMNISINTNNYENQKKLNEFSTQEMDKLIEDIKAIKAENQNLLLENRTLKDTFNKMKINLQNEIRAKESEIKTLKEKSQNLNKIEENKIENENNINKKRKPKIDINSEEFKNKDRKYIFSQFESLQEDYDRIFNDNIILVEDRKALIEKLKTKEDTTEQYHQLLEEVKQLNEENYNLQSKNLSLNNDNINLAQKAKKLENENNNIQKLDAELKNKLDIIIQENEKKEKKIEEITEKLKHAKIENENIKFKFEKYQSITDKDFSQMKEQIESLKLKCIKCENLEEQNEKLVLSKKQKDVEINDLNNLIKKLKNEIAQKPKENDINEEKNNNNNNNTESEKKLEIQNEELKNENKKLKDALNITREKLTKFGADLESKKSLLNKYYSEKKEIEIYKKEKENNINKIKELNRTIKRLEDKIKERESMKHPKKKK